ncbi:hypothetical protein [Spiroplasma endosymbiont of Atherix ibis]|uniref:hypothetical protein n=1 Tax=Spiroplasma endosymbiont of Atherix ibis TaxID=3066291 RepID=UPI0030D027D8
MIQLTTANATDITAVTSGIAQINGVAVAVKLTNTNLAIFPKAWPAFIPALSAFPAFYHFPVSLL